MNMTEDFRSEELIFMMKKIGLDLASVMDCRLKNGEISGVQVYFLVYIMRHHPQGTYLTELCRETGMSKATLSALIKKLREKNYLYFRENSKDIRRKEVFPTEKLQLEGQKFLDKIRQLEEEVCSVMSTEEKMQFWALEQKVLLQLVKMEKKEKNKDRRFVYREKSVTAIETI